jgi:cytoskeletal protein CcmA (bactofilin family)
MGAGQGGRTRVHRALKGKEGEDQMFGKTKGTAQEKDEQLPPAPQLQDSTSVSLAESDSTEISCIGPGMTVVGKISSEGSLNVLGRVEGELHASIVRISDGAEVEGTIAAQELTIGGRFKGIIQAERVTLTSSAVVEGEIHHGSLAIEENAWFAGVSHPQKTSASDHMDPPSPIQLVPPDGNRQVNGSLELQPAPPNQPAVSQRSEAGSGEIGTPSSWSTIRRGAISFQRMPGLHRCVRLFAESARSFAGFARFVPGGADVLS